MGALGDRMKGNYEDRFRHKLSRRTPVIIRLDGRAFHTLTRGEPKPFSHKFMDAMLLGAGRVAEQAQGFKLAYVQSDEASFLLTDYDDIKTDAWFDYNKSKVESISASIMSVAFSKAFGREGVFDARAFNIPESEISNYFLWRAKDWERNSLSMYCQANFSHKQLQGKRREEQHEMLFAVGKNWATDLTPREKNGAFLTSEGVIYIDPSFQSVDSLVSNLMPTPRHRV